MTFFLCGLSVLGSLAVSFSIFSQLQGMCQKQGAINDQSAELSDLGMYTMEQQAGLARLAAEQQALKENLERLNQESGNRSQILGSLDDIAKDMQKVVEDLERMNLFVIPL